MHFGIPGGGPKSWGIGIKATVRNDSKHDLRLVKGEVRLSPKDDPGYQLLNPLKAMDSLGRQVAIDSIYLAPGLGRELETLIDANNGALSDFKARAAIATIQVQTSDGETWTKRLTVPAGMLTSPHKDGNECRTPECNRLRETLRREREQSRPRYEKGYDY
jgi:hypothetical protein